MKAVILAGGLGTRLREETEFKPKPMVEVGERPILWHIMKNLSSQGIKEFVICLGYKGEVIKDFFLNHTENTHDISAALGSQDSVIFHHESALEDWTVTLANTGAETMTGGRIHRIKRYVENETFLCTYGDGLSDIQIPILIKAHLKNGGVATVTVTKPTNRFGVVEMDNALVTSFREKPQAEGWINSGYFVFNQKIWDYLDDECTLEESPMKRLSKEGSLFGYEHLGFWQAMDTYREYQLLEGLWAENRAPWRIW